MKKICILLILIISVLSSSCKKYLDAKPDKKLDVPSSLNDLQALLDNENIMNLDRPYLGEASADNYFIPFDDLQSLSEWERQIYTWNSTIDDGLAKNWQNAYNPVYYANVVLEDIKKFSRTNENWADWDNIRGSALFFRAKSFLQTAVIWAKAYNRVTAKTDLGIPLRLNSDFNQKSIRTNNQATYARIITDLRAAIPLLPVIPKSVMRPSKPAAYGLLARTYLAMQLYDSAGIYADSCLQLHENLLDYNQLDSMEAYPIGLFNDEVIFHSSMILSSLTWNEYARVDSALFNSYLNNDLRRSIFFRLNSDNTHGFRGTYGTGFRLFNGMATDEIYLIRAECYARLGETDKAMADLNRLLTARWRAGTFSQLSATDGKEALRLILRERRKELIFRGLRWMDIKRLNMGGDKIILKRMVDGVLHLLSPNDLRYAIPIPADVIDLTGMKQNPR